MKPSNPGFLFFQPVGRTDKSPEERFWEGLRSIYNELGAVQDQFGRGITPQDVMRNMKNHIEQHFTAQKAIWGE